MRIDLDPASPRATEAAERARELLTARIEGGALADEVATRIAGEVRGDFEALGYLLAAQTTMTAALVQVVMSGEDGDRRENELRLVRALLARLAAEQITI